MCSQCDFFTFNKKTLANHTARHTGQGLHVCPYCPFNSAYLGTFKRHMIRKHNSRAESDASTLEKRERLQCPHCPFVTIYKKNMKKHVAKHTGEGVHKCEHCNYVTAYIAGFRKHLLKHKKEEEYSCPHCPYTSLWKGFYERHVASKHAEKKSFACSQCNYVTPSKRSLKTHSQKHTQVDPKYKCQEDGCSFGSADIKSYKSHVASHASSEALYCTYCDYSTTLKGLFKFHLSTHPQHESYKATVKDSNDSSHKVSSTHSLKGNSFSSQVQGLHQESSSKLMPDLLPMQQQTISSERLMSHTGSLTSLPNQGRQTQLQALMNSSLSSGSGVQDTNFPAQNDPSRINNIQTLMQGTSLHNEAPGNPHNLMISNGSQNVLLKTDVQNSTNIDNSQCTYVVDTLSNTQRFVSGECVVPINGANMVHNNVPLNCSSGTSNITMHGEVPPYNDSSEKQFLCKQCDFSSADKNELRVHVSSHSGKGVLSCPHCPFSTGYQGTFKRHMSKHSRETSYQCPHCPYKSTWKGFYDRHMITKHTDVSLHQCPHCDYNTARRGTFKRHLETHSRDKTKSRKSFTLRMVQEKTEAKYSCEHCDYSSDAISSLKRHMMKHTKPDSFCCLQCSYTVECQATFTKHLQRHDASYSAPILGYSCPHCPYKTTASARFDAHLQNKHSRNTNQTTKKRKKRRKKTDVDDEEVEEGVSKGKDDNIDVTKQVSCDASVDRSNVSAPDSNHAINDSCSSTSPATKANSIRKKVSKPTLKSKRNKALEQAKTTMSFTESHCSLPLPSNSVPTDHYLSLSDLANSSDTSMSITHTASNSNSSMNAINTPTQCHITSNSLYSSTSSMETRLESSFPVSNDNLAGSHLSLNTPSNRTVRSVPNIAAPSSSISIPCSTAAVALQTPFTSGSVITATHPASNNIPPYSLPTNVNPLSASTTINAHSLPYTPPHNFTSSSGGPPSYSTSATVLPCTPVYSHTSSNGVVVLPTPPGRAGSVLPSGYMTASGPIALVQNVSSLPLGHTVVPSTTLHSCLTVPAPSILSPSCAPRSFLPSNSVVNSPAVVQNPNIFIHNSPAPTSHGTTAPNQDTNSFMKNSVADPTSAPQTPGVVLHNSANNIVQPYSNSAANSAVVSDIPTPIAAPAGHISAPHSAISIANSSANVNHNPLILSPPPGQILRPSGPGIVSNVASLEMNPGPVYRQGLYF